MKGLLLPLIPLALGACAATAPDAGPVEDAKCVVSVEPQMRMVTFADPAGLADGVTSLFFAEPPTVRPGDLVRLDNSSGKGGPQLARLESASERCTTVLHQAAGHH